jgi:hypothetical protein
MKLDLLGVSCLIVALLTLLFFCWRCHTKTKKQQPSASIREEAFPIPIFLASGGDIDLPWNKNADLATREKKGQSKGFGSYRETIEEKALTDDSDVDEWLTTTLAMVANLEPIAFTDDPFPHIQAKEQFPRSLTDLGPPALDNQADRPPTRAKCARFDLDHTIIVQTYSKEEYNREGVKRSPMSSISDGETHTLGALHVRRVINAHEQRIRAAKKPPPPGPSSRLATSSIEAHRKEPQIRFSSNYRLKNVELAEVASSSSSNSSPSSGSPPVFQASVESTDSLEATSGPVQVDSFKTCRPSASNKSSGGGSRSSSRSAPSDPYMAADDEYQGRSPEMNSALGQVMQAMREEELPSTGETMLSLDGQASPPPMTPYERSPPPRTCKGRRPPPMTAYERSPPPRTCKGRRPPPMTPAEVVALAEVIAIRENASTRAREGRPQLLTLGQRRTCLGMAI